MAKSPLKKPSYWVAGLLLLAFLGHLWMTYGQGERQGQYPQGPITIVVHSKPGSGVDLMARKVSEIARDYCSEPLIVENRPGTQGIVAMQHVMGGRPDGATLLATTRSFLSTLIVNRTKVSVDDFHFLAILLEDPEALVVHRSAEVNDFASLMENLESGSSVWIGPGIGSRDHLMALKTWSVLGHKGRWIDYKSGPQSILGLLRKEAPVYVGNAQDLAGKPDLKLAVVASPVRLAGFPDTPTFKELGFDLEESMWRGLAVRKGTPAHITDYLTQLLDEVTRDDRWSDYCAGVHALPLTTTGPDLQERIEHEVQETRELLQGAGLLRNYRKEAARVRVALGLGLLMFLPLLVWKVVARKTIPRDVWPATGLLWLSLVIFHESSLFLLPENARFTDPALMPRIWAGVLFMTGAWLVFSSLRRAQEKIDKPGGVRVMGVVLALVVYFWLIPRAGYSIPTFVMTAGLMAWLGYRKPAGLVTGASAFVLFVHLVFGNLLGIDLPTGTWF